MFYLLELKLSVAYSYSWTDLGRQSRPGSHLLNTYLENLPQDLSACFE